LLRVELLEDRSTPAAVGDFHEVIAAGSPTASPMDSPDQRVDPNTAASPYAGVGSVEVDTRDGGMFIGTGSVIGPRYVLTAAHVVDLNNDGKVDRKDGLQGVYFVLNDGGDETARIPVTGFALAPDFAGFRPTSPGNDLAILTLAEDVPPSVPEYPLPARDMTTGTVLTFVGYGRSGDGVHGYTTPASLTVKRVGQNTADELFAPAATGKGTADGLFKFDFDGPTGNGPLGGPTLGNTLETQLGPCDSGCPAFATAPGGLVLAGIGTFTQGDAPLFGSTGGGVNLFPDLAFIDSVVGPPAAVSPAKPPAADVGSGTATPETSGPVPSPSSGGLPAVPIPATNVTKLDGPTDGSFTDGTGPMTFFVAAPSGTASDATTGEHRRGAAGRTLERVDQPRIGTDTASGSGGHLTGLGTVRIDELRYWIEAAEST
jgi:hypothetical protein